MKKTYKPPKNEYPYTLKEFTGEPKIKKNGKPFKWGTIIPLIGGCSLGCALATNKKPDFMLTWDAFKDNQKSLDDYWPDVPVYNLDEFEYTLPEYNIEKESDEEQDLKQLDLLKDHFKDVDFINAVPPCAGLSSLNASKGKSNMSRGADAIQNQWMYRTAHFVLTHIKPKVLWGENAPGLFTKIGKPVADNLAKIAKSYGYSFSLMKTNSLYHGIPQKRERTFYFFWKSKYAPILNYVSKERVHLVDYLESIPKGTNQWEDVEWSVDDPKYPSYEWALKEYGKTHAEWVKEHDHTTLHGFFGYGGMADKIIDIVTKSHGEDHWEVKNLKHVKNKLSQSKGWWDNSPHFFYDHFNALVGRNIYRGMHPTRKRFLNTRELIWMMGHPHDFDMYENENGNVAVHQISQNVPVVTASHWALEVMKFIDGDLESSGEVYNRQNNKDAQKQSAFAKKVKKLF